VPQLAVWIEPLELVFPGEPEFPRASQHSKPIEIDDKIRRHHRLNRLAIGKADHGFCPVAARDMRDSGLILRGIRRQMRKDGVGDIRPAEELLNRGHNCP
jgi:hypothetical protein